MNLISCLQPSLLLDVQAMQYKPLMVVNAKLPANFTTVSTVLHALLVIVY
jgi:hypothetical protein